MLHDVRFAVRLLAKHRWFTLAATMALALGIGMNAMVFTLVNALLLRSLPFEDPDRVLYVGERDTVTGRNFMVSWPDFQDWRDSQKSFVGLGRLVGQHDERQRRRTAARAVQRRATSRRTRFKLSR